MVGCDPAEGGCESPRADGRFVRSVPARGPMVHDLRLIHGEWKFDSSRADPRSTDRRSGSSDSTSTRPTRGRPRVRAPLGSSPPPKRRERRAVPVRRRAGRESPRRLSVCFCGCGRTARPRASNPVTRVRLSPPARASSPRRASCDLVIAPSPHDGPTHGTAEFDPPGAQRRLVHGSRTGRGPGPAATRGALPWGVRGGTSDFRLQHPLDHANVRGVPDPARHAGDRELDSRRSLSPAMDSPLSPLQHDGRAPSPYLGGVGSIPTGGLAPAARRSCPEPVPRWRRFDSDRGLFACINRVLSDRATHAR